MNQFGELVGMVRRNQGHVLAEQRTKETDFWLDGGDMLRIYEIAAILYLEQRLNADTQRDMAHILMGIFDGAIEALTPISCTLVRDPNDY